MENQNPHPKFKDQLNGHNNSLDIDSIVLHLPRNKAEALNRNCGRTIGWWSLLLNTKDKKGMTFVIITHVLILRYKNSYFAYGPYVIEMNIWIKRQIK
jgi:hypothetical protein